jgi:chromosomal replication initiation ATPase DnaA
MATQLGFDLPVRAALGREDFFVSPANAMAVALLEGWQGWPGRKLLLIGPAGAGKTHLAHVWAAQSSARILPAAGLEQADIPAFARGQVVVEDIDQIAGQQGAEQALFHLHNLVIAEGHSLLLTSACAPQHLGLSLPDLQSRVQGCQSASLGAPDDRLLGAVLMKLFADRQLVPTPDTLPYLVRWMTRSFDSARQIVAEMDAQALAQGRPLNRALAREVLARHVQPDMLDNPPT